MKVASTCFKKLKLTIPGVIDDLKNSCDKEYAGWPDRIYIVGKDGKIAYKGDIGPRGFKPGDAEKALKELLSSDETTK